MVFKKQIKEKEEYVTRVASGLQSLKYLLSGPLEKTVAKSCLGQLTESLGQVLEVGPLSFSVYGGGCWGRGRCLTCPYSSCDTCLTCQPGQGRGAPGGACRGSDITRLSGTVDLSVLLCFFKLLCLLPCDYSLGWSCCFFQSSLCHGCGTVSIFKTSRS